MKENHKLELIQSNKHNIIIQMIIIYTLWNLFWIILVFYQIKNPFYGILSDFAYSYLLDFILIGIIACCIIGEQPIRNFSSNVLKKHNLFSLLTNAIFIVIIVVINSSIYKEAINWTNILHFSIDNIMFNGFVEEWIFRGYFVSQFLRIIKSKRNVVIISAVIFSLMHLPNYLLTIDTISIGGIIYRLLIPFLMGIALATIFVKTRNLFICVLVHGVYNLISDVTWDWWMYVCYGIYWVMLLLYLWWCCKKTDKDISLS